MRPILECSGFMNCMSRPREGQSLHVIFKFNFGIVRFKVGFFFSKFIVLLFLVHVVQIKCILSCLVFFHKVKNVNLSLQQWIKAIYIENQLKSMVQKIHTFLMM